MINLGLGNEVTNCTVYPNETFRYDSRVGLGVITLSSIGLLANVFLFTTFILSLFYRKKSKTSSLDKLFVLLSFVEACISIYWLVNAITFFENAGPTFPEDKCQNCKYLALYGIFLYCLDWTLLTATIYQFKQIISNPIAAILKPDKQIRLYFIVCLLMSGAAVGLSYWGKNNGINPMFTCFISTYQILNSHPVNILSIVLFGLLMLIPSANFYYGFYQSIVMFKNILAQKDTETKNLFLKYISYFLVYILSIFCLFLLHVCDIFIEDKRNNTSYLSFAYGTSIFNCSTPLIVAIFRLAQKYGRIFTRCDCRSKGHPLSRMSLEVNSIEISPINQQFEKLEKESIKKFTRDIYISISYIASQAKKLSQQVFALQPKHFTETSRYNISLNKLMSNSEAAIKEDPIIKESQTVDIDICEFAPKIFASLRQKDEVTEDQLIESFLPSHNRHGIQESQGKSGNFFMSSDDKKYILKTINYDDLELIRGLLLEKITNHFNSESSSSIISRIYGMYKLIMPTGFFNQEEVILILMKNVCDVFDEQIMGKYDIKGSKFDRSVTMTNINFSKKVMKDNNFEQLEGAFYMNEENSRRFLNIIRADANFFCSLGIMDYSLLVVKVKINEDEMKYLFGMKHREKTEREYMALVGEDGGRRPSIEEIKEMDETLNRQINKENIRFDRKEIITLKKYLFPSLTPDTMYIFSIIDFFQLYDIKKNLETKFKSLLAKRDIISSVPPEDYAKRFINHIEQKVNQGFEGLKKMKKMKKSQLPSITEEN